MHMTGRDYMIVTPIRETECHLFPIENQKKLVRGEVIYQKLYLIHDIFTMVFFRCVS